MHKGNGHADRSFDAALLNEEGIVDQMTSTERSSQASDHLRLSLEIAVEWAHLGGD
jgi:hypothetical protein